MPKKKHKNRYADYSERIQAFAADAISRLNKRYGGKIPSYILIQLDQAAETLDLIADCKKSIKDDGMLIEGERGNSKKLNPAAQLLNISQSTLNRILTALMLTCNSEDKARKADHGEQNMLLDELINGSVDEDRDYDEDGE